MGKNLSRTDKLSFVHCAFLATTFESICASHCCKQTTEPAGLQIWSMIVDPMSLRLESSIYWEVNNGARTTTGIAYYRGINTSKPHFIK